MCKVPINVAPARDLSSLCMHPSSLSLYLFDTDANFHAWIISTTRGMEFEAIPTSVNCSLCIVASQSGYRLACGDY